jgi:Uma2 family endonuclease
MAEPAPRHGMTVGEFLAYDDGTDVRYELVGGEMIATNPPAEPHVQLTSNLFGALSRRLTRPCRAYFGGGVWLSETDDTWREPDIFVSCQQGEGFSQTPRLIVQVLSPSTEREDRTRKLDFYKAFTSVEAILFVWQDTQRIELRERAGEGWLVRDFIGSGTILVATMGLAVPLEEIYT